MRRFIRPRLVDLSGNVLRDGWLRVLDPTTAAEVDVFATSAGGSALTQPLTTDVRGEVECWLDAGTSVDLEWSDSGATKIAATGRTVSFDTFTEFVDADPVAVANTHAALPDLATSGHPASVISGLGGAALLNVGSGAGTVAAGDDSRITGAVPKSLVDAAGDLLVGTAADTVARLPMGSALQVLRVNSGATAPEWAAQSGLVVNTVAAAGSTETLAGDTYNVHDVTLDESVEFTFTTSATVAQFTLILRQDVSGGNSVTWPGSVKWHSLTAPTILTTASAVHVLEFLTVDTGTTWRGFLASSAAS